MTERVLLLDNRDSFVWNLAHGLHRASRRLQMHGVRMRDFGIDVVRSDLATIDEITRIHPAAVVLSPGPGRPAEAGVLLDAVRAFSDLGTPMLGVCLGHQAIGQAFGAELIRGEPLHGEPSVVEHDGTGLFEGTPAQLAMARYHSLRLAPESITDPLRTNAWLSHEVDTCMGIMHRELPIHGFQFHPESFLSGDSGVELLERFLVAALTERPPRA